MTILEAIGPQVEKNTRELC